MDKRVLIFALALPLLVLSGCTREQDFAAESSSVVTIRVSLPDEPLTKAGFSVPDEGSGLHLAWQAGDCIRVISGTASAVYQIEDGFTDHVASFSGPEVAGTTFDIITPGTYTSVDEAEAGNPALTQTGNGSTDHLAFTARLSGVSKADLPDITFSDDWVAEHAGTSLNRGGIVKFVLTLPAAVTSPKKVLMQGLGNDVSVNLQNITLGSDRVLTAYAQCGWDDIDISGQEFTITVMDADGSAYAATKTISGSKTLKAGAQNSMVIKSGFTLQLFAGGNGTASNPYLIANAVQLNNMHADGVLKSQEKVYFRLIDDIDMAGFLADTPWIPLNSASPYDYCIDFDGDNHTIDHFSCSYDSAVDTYDKPSFFGLLYGSCYDVSFTNASITTNKGTAGVLGGYIGYNGKKAVVYNVHVQGTITRTSSDGDSGIGGLAGRIVFSYIDSCSADVEINCTVKDFVGGLFGIDWNQASRVRNCWTAGVIHGSQKVGGICGGLIRPESQVINCFSTVTLDAMRFAGGIIGDCCNDAGSNSNYQKAGTLTPDNVVQGCIAWQSSFTARDHRDPYVDSWSSGAIIGFTATHNYLTDCRRNAAVDAAWIEVNACTPYDQENASPSTPLVVNNPNSSVMKHYSPYHGKAFSGTLSACARSLGWNEEVWDLSGSVPVLTGVVEELAPTEAPSSGAGDVPPGSDALRGLGEVRPQAGDAGWTIKQIADGITYYSYSDYCPETENKYQDVYVIDLDLSNPNYKVKVVYATPTTTCSDVRDATDAYAAINGGYEIGSIALKANAVWNGESLTSYSSGIPLSYVPNNFITDNQGYQVPNWKSEGTFYCDGNRNLQIAFDGYDPETATKTKTVQEERLFYQLCTDSWPALISSAPVLIHDFNPVGKKFKDLHPRESSSAEDPNTHQRGQYPRTAVALTEGNHFLMVVCDGRYATGYGGNGMSAYWLTVFLAKYFNPQYALNLDGGGSSTMCVKDSEFAGYSYVVNYPCDNMGSSGKTHNHTGQRARDSFIAIVKAE